LNTPTIEIFPEAGEAKWEEDVRYPRFRFKRSVYQTPFRDVKRLALTVEHDGTPETTMETYEIRP